MITELQKKLAEIQNTQKSLIQESLNKPEASLFRLFQQAKIQEERLKSQLDEVMKRYGAKIPEQVIALKPNGVKSR